MNAVNLFCQSICAACLSQDRKLYPLNDCKSQASFLNVSEGDKLCWECHFFVLKVFAFRSRAQRAQALLASALHQTNVTNINSLSSLMMTPTHLEIMETSDPLEVEITIKTEVIKEECENTEDTCNSDDVPCNEYFEEMEDDNLLPDLNVRTEAEGDEACGEAIGDDNINASLKSLMNRKNLLDKTQENPYQMERNYPGDEPTCSRTLEQQPKPSCFVGLERIPLGDEQAPSYTIPVTFNCNLKRKAESNLTEDNMDEEENIVATPEQAAEQAVTENLLPTKSRHLYDKSYEKFMAWRMEHQTSSFSENVLLAYFKDLNEKFKPSSVWVEYSKLKSTLNIYHQTDISKYSKLLDLLKRNAEGFKAKKAKTFSPDEIQKFIQQAPDQEYLFLKVAVIFGIMGACRRQELHNLKMTNIIDAHNALVVQVMNSKNKIDRTFAVTGKYYDICKKYLDLRPNQCRSPNVFLRYMNGKYIEQNIGINTFGQMGKTVASYLNLPNPELYTGHCFRRTSATILVDASGDMASLIRRGSSKPTAVAETCIDNSINSRKKVSNVLTTSTEQTVPQKNIPFTLIPDPQAQCSPTPETQADWTIPSKGPSTLSLSKIIEQNSAVHINNSTSANIPNIALSKNSIQNLHLHFH